MNRLPPCLVSVCEIVYTGYQSALLARHIYPQRSAQPHAYEIVVPCADGFFLGTVLMLVVQHQQV